MNFLPVLDHDAGKHPCNVISAIGGSGFLVCKGYRIAAGPAEVTTAQQNTSQPLSTKVAQAAQTTKGKPPAGAKQVSTQKSKASKQSQTPNAAEARKKAVYRAMEQLLEHGAFSDADLLRSIPNLSGDEFLQVLRVHAALNCSLRALVLYHSMALCHLYTVIRLCFLVVV